MIAGNDRLEDIAFYQEQVRYYSDNGLSIPGSSYGKRLFDPQPGIDQINSAIKVLKENPSSRRACASIWQPIDATRIMSKDLPCAFGINFEIRNEKLYSTLVMRSNNAATLLPTNLFEFTMLGEIVAKELGVKFGGHIHDVFSMHIFHNHKDDAIDIVKAFDEMDVDENFSTMPDMPMDPSPLEEARTLSKLEATLRNQNVFYGLDNLEVHLKKAKKILHPYWFEFYKVLAIGVLVNLEKFKEASNLAYSLKPYFKIVILAQLKILELKAQEEKHTTLDMFVEKKESNFKKIKEIYKLSKEEQENREKQVYKICQEWNKTHVKRLTVLEENQVIDVMIKKVAGAARSEKKPQPGLEPSEDYLQISKNEVFDIIKDILEKR